jgi:hypothetical protein
MWKNQPTRFQMPPSHFGIELGSGTAALLRDPGDMAIEEENHE